MSSRAGPAAAAWLEACLGRLGLAAALVALRWWGLPLLRLACADGDVVGSMGAGRFAAGSLKKKGAALPPCIELEVATYLSHV